VIYFYELFLQAYDAEQRKDRGVYYTPTPVVRFIVRAVDRALIEHLGIPEGLADAQKETYSFEVSRGHSTSKSKKRDTPVIQERRLHRVQVLDPAVGTATFLNETIRHIHRGFENQEGSWPGYVRDDLLPRLHGFELMMAPYAIAHIKLTMTLGELGISDPGQPTGVYLTNTLERAVELEHDLFTIGLAGAFSEEAARASQIKTETPIMVVMGNPPYSGHSENRSEHANSLVDRYKVEPGGSTKLQERNPKWLNDDYVKFIAFGEQLIAKNPDGGILAMITNNGFLDNPTFRGMRWHLTNTFNQIYIVDLHGSLKKKETAPDGSKDENVFDIQQGVSIMVAIKRPNAEAKPATVLHADLYGTRATKFKALDADEIVFKEVHLDPKFYFFQARDAAGRDDYQAGIPLTKIFKKSVVGQVTGRDKLTIDNSRDVLWKRVSDFISLAPEDARVKYALGKDVRDWKVERAQADVREGHHEERMVPITYRPFDVRWTYYTGNVKGFSQYPRYDVLKDMRDDYSNVALVVGRQGNATGAGEWTLAYVARHIIDLNVFYRGGGYVFPKRIRTKDGDWTDNITDRSIAMFEKSLGIKPKTDDVFAYIYGLLNSTVYRTDASEFLKSDYPIITPPENVAEFNRYVIFGERLMALHLLDAPDILSTSSLVTSFPNVGSDVVGKCLYDSNSQQLWINPEQFIGNVTPAMWEYRIGGYQVVKKWLKDRKGIKLSAKEIRHIQTVLTAIDACLIEIAEFNAEM
jgi:predicted helicase